MKSLKRYWNESKERGVVAAVVVYAVAGFVLLLISDVLALLVVLPTWARPVILKTVLLGLPVTIIVAWMYNYRRQMLPVGGRDLDAVEEDERARSASYRKTASIVAGLLVGAALLGAAMSVRKPKVIDSARVVVAPFENATTDTALDNLGELTADEIAMRLTQNRELNIVPYSSIVAYTVISPLRPGSAYERSIDLAHGVDANYVLWGSYYLSKDTLRISGQITDARTGDLVADIARGSAPSSDAAMAIGRFRENAARVVGRLLHVQRSGGVLSSLPIAQPAAHERFTAGLWHYVAADYAGAAEQFDKAGQADSTFVVARIWLARTLAEQNNMPAADSLSHSLERFRTRLNAYDRAQLDYVQAFSTYNISLRYGASTLMTMIAPPSDDGQRLLALDALAMNHPREARSILLALNPDKGWMRGWPGYYAALAASYHLIGDYRDEEHIVLDGLRRYPHSLDLWVADCRARAALMKSEQDWWRIKFMADQPQQRNQIMVGNALTRCSEELIAHGQARIAAYAANLAVSWFRRAGPQVPARLRSDYSLALMMLGQRELAYDEMKRTLQLPIASYDLPIMQARMAYFAAVSGHRQDAFVFDSAANAGTDRYGNPYVTLERARVSAALGDTQTAWTLMNDALSNGVPFAEPRAILLHADVTLRKLWDLPGFTALLRPAG